MSEKFTHPSMRDVPNFDVLPICKKITSSSIVACALAIREDCQLPENSVADRVLQRATKGTCNHLILASDIPPGAEACAAGISG